MLVFEAYKDGATTADVDLSGAYVFAQDGIPVRADIVSEGNQINCMKNTPGACGLAVVWEVGENGKYMLNTTRLRDRRKPFNLNLELARARMMKLYQKREAWGLFDHEDMKACNDEFNQIRNIFISALQTEVSDQAEAAKLADEALNKAMLFGEKMALLHTEIMIKHPPLAMNNKGIICGTTVPLTEEVAASTDKLRDGMDFVTIPMPWALLEPEKGKNQFEMVDKWIDWATHEKKVIHAGPIISFAPDQLPQWLFRWKDDFGTMLSLVKSHVERVIERYAGRVGVWNVASGLHSINAFDLNFDQITELTRSVCRLAKKAAPNSQVLIDIPMPWGEYYARNQRTVPPLLFSDMAYQNDMKFDAFGLHIEMGIPEDGYFVRDILEISARLDEFTPYGKAIHITACQVPSSSQTSPLEAGKDPYEVEKAGRWHGQWSQRLQAEWLQAVYRIAFSRGIVESFCWRDLADGPDHCIPNCGLCSATMEPKLAYKELRNLHIAMQQQTQALFEGEVI